MKVTEYWKMKNKPQCTDACSRFLFSMLLSLPWLFYLFTVCSMSSCLCKNCSQNCQANADTDTKYCCYGISWNSIFYFIVPTISKMSHTSNVMRYIKSDIYDYDNICLNRVQFCNMTQDAVECFISCPSMSLFPHKFVQIRGQFFSRTSPHGSDFQLYSILVWLHSVGVNTRCSIELHRMINSSVCQTKLWLNSPVWTPLIRMNYAPSATTLEIMCSNVALSRLSTIRVYPSAGWNLVSTILNTHTC